MMQAIVRLVLVGVGLLINMVGYAQLDTCSLRRDLEQVIARANATVGCALLTEDGHLVTVHDSTFYPLMSVFKFHVALVVLKKMETQHVSLDSTIIIKAAQLRADTYSPLRDRYPNSDLSVSYQELLRYSVSESDNNACDLLLEFVGGITAVNAYIQHLNLPHACELTETEASMHADIMNCYKNYSSPSHMVNLLRLFDSGSLLSEEHTVFLRNIMLATVTGKDKIRSGLPDNVQLAHKTGSSDRLPSGEKIGDNDAGIIILPDGRRCYLAVFIKDSLDSDILNSSLIAFISRLVYSYLSTACCSSPKTVADLGFSH